MIGHGLAARRARALNRAKNVSADAVPQGTRWQMKTVDGNTFFQIIHGDDVLAFVTLDTAQVRALVEGASAVRADRIEKGLP